MHVQHILPIKVSISIDTMLNFHGDFVGHIDGDVTWKQISYFLLARMLMSRVFNQVNITLIIRPNMGDYHKDPMNEINRASGGSEGGARDAPPPRGSKFFQFHAVFWGNLAKLYVGAPPGSWRPLLGEILYPLLRASLKVTRPPLLGFCVSWKDIWMMIGRYLKLVITYLATSFITIVLPAVVENICMLFI